MVRVAFRRNRKYRAAVKRVDAVATNLRVRARSLALSYRIRDRVTAVIRYYLPVIPRNTVLLDKISRENLLLTNHVYQHKALHSTHYALWNNKPLSARVNAR